LQLLQSLALAAVVNGEGLSVQNTPEISLGAVSL
ncbi:unnamed protein product, partial [Allacma fusca]